MADDAGLLHEIIRRIVAKIGPQRLILFGSRARDSAHRKSDYDLLLIMESKEPRYRRCAPLYTALADLPAEVDLVAYTPAEVREWSTVPEAFVTTAIREGKVVYERTK